MQIEGARFMMKLSFIESKCFTKVNNQNIPNHYLWSFATYVLDALAEETSWFRGETL